MPVPERTLWRVVRSFEKEVSSSGHGATNQGTTDFYVNSGYSNHTDKDRRLVLSLLIKSSVVEILDPFGYVSKTLDSPGTFQTNNYHSRSPLPFKPSVYQVRNGLKFRGRSFYMIGLKIRTTVPWRLSPKPVILFNGNVCCYTIFRDDRFGLVCDVRR